MTVRKVFFWCHLIAGCVAGIVILIMSVTGVLLAFQRQITAWGDRGYQVMTQQTGPPQFHLDQLGTSSRPGGDQPPTITVRSGRTAPIEMSYGRDRTLFIDPSSGNVLGEASYGARHFFATVERFHRSLGSQLRSGFGRPITGACNLAFLFMILSGVYLWVPRKWAWQQFRSGLWFRGGLKGRARDWNWHNTVGFWCAIPLFFIVLSGVIMSYPWANNLLYQATGTRPPTPPGGRGGSSQGGDSMRREGRPVISQEVAAENIKAKVKSAQELLAIAEQQMPGWRSISFRPARIGDRSITFSLDSGNGGQPQARTDVTLDRVSGRIIRAEGFATYNQGRKLRTIARFLHTGEILGIGGQFVAAAASLGGAVLVWTGLALGLRRFGSWRRREARSRHIAADLTEPAATRS